VGKKDMEGKLPSGIVEHRVGLVTLVTVIQVSKIGMLELNHPGFV
jgi:hypothetical protein